MALFGYGSEGNRSSCVKGCAGSGTSFAKRCGERMTAPALKRELGLRDVSLFAIVCIIGMRWIAAAAHAGPGSVTLWVLAAMFFVAPLATAIGALGVKYPGAGGL